MQRSLVSVFALSFVTSLACAACAGDANKQANDAHDAQLKADRQKAEDGASQRGDARVQAAEMQRNNADANAAANPPATRTTAATEATMADAKAVEARNVYRAKATERLEKADARTLELRQLVDKAGSKATTASHDALTTIGTQRTLVARSLDALPQVAGDDFKSFKSSLDGQLDDLENLVKKASAEVDKFKK